MTSEAYARGVIGLYLTLPGVTGRAGRADWALARTLHAEGAAFEIVEAAMLLAVARRAGRDPEAPPLHLVRSLAYFRPVIDELIAQPVTPTYVEYLREIVSTITRPRPARVRKTAFLRDR